MAKTLRIALNALEGRSRARGTDSYCRNLIAGLAAVDRENEYHVFTNREADYRRLTGGAPNFHFIDPHIDENAISTVDDDSEKRGLSADVLWLNTRLMALLDQLGVDLFHSLGFIGPFIARRTRTFRIISTIHGLEHEVVPQFFNPRLMELLRKTMPRTCEASDHLISVSSDVKKCLGAYYHIPEAKVSVVLHGIDSGVFAEKAAEEDSFARAKRPYFLFVSALEKRKNLDTVLRAFSILKKGRGLSLVIVGDGTCRDYYRKEIESLGLADFVFLRGTYEDPRSLADVYGMAEALVFPSYYEGFGLVAAEAMMCGTPVIASGLSALPEVVGRGGLLVEPDDSAGIASAMERVSSEEGLRAALGRAARMQAARYTRERMASETVRVYRRIVGQRESENDNACV